MSAIQAVYLDTSLIAAAVAQPGQRPTVASYLQTLLQNDAMVFVPELVRVELGQAIKAIANDPAAIPNEIAANGSSTAGVISNLCAKIGTITASRLTTCSSHNSHRLRK